MDNPNDAIESDLLIDDICQSYEDSLKAGRPIPMEDCLAKAPIFLHDQLKEELNLIARHRQNKNVPSAIGPYTLKNKIGEGGMGEVWIANQTSPVKRTVALKLIKTGMDTRTMLARFEQERQTLALLDHPNIARVLDGGMTDEGRPYFVMEFVDGLPLLKYCDDHHLGITDRLQLFNQICQAVQHAHQKGVIHRDLKPSNILVAQYDGRPLIKVIDFGVAKVVGDPAVDNSLATQPGMILGTLEYMAPEQAGRTSADVDTRADVYSLGVILYEIIAGVRPFSSRRLRDASFEQALRILREEEPPRPSTRLSGEESLSLVAQARGIEPKSLLSMIRGDLDWIAMKCLDKDRNRRYSSASELQRDLERYLADEAIEARPPSSGYRIRKFVRRNRGAVVSGVAIVLALVIGAAMTTRGMLQAKDAERRATHERNEKEIARLNEETQRIQATKSLAQTEQANRILLSIFEDLNVRKIRDGTEPIEAILARKLVEAGKLIDESIADPFVASQLQHKLANTLHHLGYSDQAIGIVEKSIETKTAELGSDHTNTLSARTLLAQCYMAQGKQALAIPMLETNLAAVRRKFGENHENTLSHQQVTFDAYARAGKLTEAIALGERTVQQADEHLGHQHPQTLVARSNLANAYYLNREYHQSLKIERELLETKKRVFGHEHPDVLTSLNNIALYLSSSGRVNDAKRILLDTLEVEKKILGERHPITLTARHNLATTLIATGDNEGALPHLEDVLKYRRTHWGEKHIDHLAVMHALSRCYLNLGRTKDSVARLQETLNLSRELKGREDRMTITAMNDLAFALAQYGQHDQSFKLSQETLALIEKSFPNDDSLPIACTNNVAVSLMARGKPNQAIPVFESNLKIMNVKPGPHAPETLAIRYNLAVAHQKNGDSDQARPIFDDTIALMMDKLGPNHPTSRYCLRDYIWTRILAKEPDSVLQLCERLLKERRQTLGNTHEFTAQAMLMFAQALDKTKRYREALLLYEEALPLLEKQQGLQHSDTELCRTAMPSCYAAEGRFREAAEIQEKNMNLRIAKSGPDHPHALTDLTLTASYYGFCQKHDLAKTFLERALLYSNVKNGQFHAETLKVMETLSTTYGRLKEYANEEVLCREMVRSQKKLSSKGGVTECKYTLQLGQCLYMQRRHSDAEGVLREAIAGYEKFAPGSVDHAYSRTVLGGSLVGQKRFADAEKALLESYEVLNSQENRSVALKSGKLTLTVALIAGMYKLWDKPDEMMKWQTIFSKLNTSEK